MTDIRKPVHTPTEEQRSLIVKLVHRRLLATTEEGAKELSMTGASFVLIGMGVWANELAEINGRSTAKLLRALGDLFDPRTNDGQKRRAEKDRSQAVRDLLAGVDLVMNEAQGNG